MKRAVVWRWQLDAERTEVDMPTGAQILHVGFQVARRAFSVWALVDPQAPREWRAFQRLGTGGEAAPSDTYLGSVLMPDGYEVYHFFEIAP